MYKQLISIDGSIRHHHRYLEPNDYCYFFGEYNAHKGYGHSDTNQLIFNLKKGIDRKKNPDEYRHKTTAIQTVAGVLKQTLSHLFKPATKPTFVPIPPSKCRSDPLHDDRLTQILHQLSQLISHVDYKELVVQTGSRPTVHKDNCQRNPDEIKRLYTINESLTETVNNHLIIFDDMLTTGCQFKAMKAILSQRFPHLPITGLFIARCVPELSDAHIFS